MQDLRAEEITRALSANNRRPHRQFDLTVSMQEVSERILNSLGADRASVSAEVVALFDLSHPNPSCVEYASGVRLKLANGAQFELVVSEFNGWVPEALKGTKGFYMVVSEPKYRTTLSGHKILNAMDLPDAERQFISVVREALAPNKSS